MYILFCPYGQEKQMKRQKDEWMEEKTEISYLKNKKNIIKRMKGGKIKWNKK